MKFSKYLLFTIFFTLQLLAFNIANAAATNVFSGKDYFHTLGGSSFDFGGPIGNVNFLGLAIDPINFGNTDTIITRLDDAILPTVGSFDIINIEMTALSLQSVSAINVGGLDFNVFVGLDSNQQSLGQMLINHELDDDFGDGAEGTFDSRLTLFLDATFTEVGGTGINDFIVDVDNFQLDSIGSCWSHEYTGKPAFPDEGPNFFLTECPTLGEVDIEGLGIGGFDQTTGTFNDHTFTHHFPGFPLGSLPPVVNLTGVPILIEFKPDGDGIHGVIPATFFIDGECFFDCGRRIIIGQPDDPNDPFLVTNVVPSPSTLYLIVFGFISFFKTHKIERYTSS